jgi:zinc protease
MAGDPNHRVRIVGLGSIVVVALVSCAAQSRFHVARSGETKYRVHVEETHWDLPNRMSAILLPDPATDLVEVDMRYQAGARDDPPGKEGLAHLVEHLMFTQRVGGSDKPSLGTRLRERALYVNASTTLDYTHYTSLAHNVAFEDLLEIEASRLVVGCQTIPQAVLDREREVVRNEIRSKPAAVLVGQINQALYPPGHPYARSPGGTDASLATITLEDVCTFVKRNYNISRAILVVAGNVDPERMSAGLRRYFGSIRVADFEPRAAVPKLTARPETVTLEASVTEPIVLAVWPAPPDFSDDQAAVDMGLSTLVTFPTTTSLVSGQRREGSMHQFYGGSEAPFVGIHAVVHNSSDIEKTKRQLLEMVERRELWIKSALRLDFVRSVHSVGLLSNFESLADRTRQFADWQQFGDTRTGPMSQLQSWNRYDVDALQGVLAKTCDPTMVRFIVLKPSSGKATAVDQPPSRLRIDLVDEIPVDVQEAGQVGSIPANLAPQSPASFALANGLGVAFQPTASGLPMVTVRLTFHVGTAHDPPDKLGLALLTAGMLRSPAAAANQSTYATDNSFVVGDESTTFQLHGLAIHLEAMLATLGSLIEEGEYPNLSHGTRAYEQLTEPKRLKTISVERALRGAMFGADHPYVNTGDIAPWTWENIGRFDLSDFRKRHYVGKNGILIVAGAFDPDQARTLADKYLSGIPAGVPTDRVSPARPVRAGAMGIVKEADALTPIVLGWPAGPRDDAQYPARLVAVRILDRRMQIVRQSLGAAYDVSAQLLSLSAGGVYLVSGRVDSQRAAEALRIMRAQAAALRAGEKLEGDFVRSRQEVIRQLVGAASASPEVAASIEWVVRSGRSPTYREELMAQVAKLTVADVRKVLANDLRLAHEAIAVSGPREFLDKTFAAADLTAVRYVDLK